MLDQRVPEAAALASEPAEAVSRELEPSVTHEVAMVMETGPSASLEHSVTHEVGPVLETGPASASLEQSIQHEVALALASDFLQTLDSCLRLVPSCDD